MGVMNHFLLQLEFDVIKHKRFSELSYTKPTVRDIYSIVVLISCLLQKIAMSMIYISCCLWTLDGHLIVCGG